MFSYEDPERFVPEVEALWKTMNEGGSLPFIGKILQFNGGLFREPSALPLTKQQIWLLKLAASSDWRDVEPAIFGTLLERALDPKERHALGAHYTPRAYVERLVRPTIEEPLRAEWELVQAEVRQIMTGAKTDDDRKAMLAARKPVQAFYDRLRRIRILDPACGSGNFLFVALDLLA
jgi:type II restriction/modification system DNA methylase subunit YeeA